MPMSDIGIGIVVGSRLVLEIVSRLGLGGENPGDNRGNQPRRSDAPKGPLVSMATTYGQHSISYQGGLKMKSKVHQMSSNST